MTGDMVGGEGKRFRYSFMELLDMRKLAASVEMDVPDYADEEENTSVAKKPELLCFRKVPTRSNDIKFHCDMDVPSNFIVHAYSLDSGVGWPHLSTFCAKTVGVKPLDIRMMRRSKPAQARLIFNSAEEAVRFIDAVPTNARLKGSIPKFVLDTKAPRGSTTHSECIASVPVHAQDIAECGSEHVATAVVWTKKSEKAAFAQSADESDCCHKEVAKGLVQAAVLVDGSKKGGKPAGRAKQAGNKGKTMQQCRGKAIAAICVAHMPSTLVVDM